MSFSWLRPLGKWLLRAIVNEIMSERAPATDPPARGSIVGPRDDGH